MTACIIPNPYTHSFNLAYSIACASRLLVVAQGCEFESTSLLMPISSTPPLDPPRFTRTRVLGREFGIFRELFLFIALDFFRRASVGRPFLFFALLVSCAVVEDILHA